MIDKVDLLRSSKVRRAKLYYLRGLKGKAARLRDVERPSSSAFRIRVRVPARVSFSTSSLLLHPVFGNHFQVGEVLSPRFFQLRQHMFEQRTVALPDVLERDSKGVAFGVPHLPP